jgi:hypothetical protein
MIRITIELWECESGRVKYSMVGGHVNALGASAKEMVLARAVTVGFDKTMNQVREKLPGLIEEEGNSPTTLVERRIDVDG